MSARNRTRSKRTLAVVSLALAGITATSTNALAASSHQNAPGGKGEAWFNSANCCIVQRNAFTVKNAVVYDGYEVKVEWKGARSGSFRLQDSMSEWTFSIAGDVPRAAIQWRTCTVDNPTGVTNCNPSWITDYID